MRIAIIGAGAVGMLFATYLHQAGHKITVYTHSEKQARAINENGITRYFRHLTRRFAVKAEALTAGTELNASFIIICVKQYHLEKVFPVLQKSAGKKAFLFVQNGMGHLPLLETLMDRKLYIGVVEHGAIKQSHTEVCHSGEGIVKISNYLNHDDEHQAFIHSWQQNHFPIQFVANWYELLANKLVVNAVINPLTAILQVKNGELLHNPYFLRLMNKLYDETVSVLDVPKSELWDHVQSVCRKTADNQSSMLRDIQAKRKTEIEAINGYVLSLAKDQGKSLPYTEFVVNAIKGLES